MLALIHNKHKNKSAAIIGSGPSAKLFKKEQDISIAVNGAAFLRQDFDYFLCGDHHSHEYSWFRINCSKFRVIARLVASLDYQLYPTDFDDVIERKAVPAHKQRQVSKLICPLFPHMVFNYRWYKEGRLKKNNNYLMFGGTISCCAAQMAYMMGCTEIHLYGCNFTHKKQHYFYNNEEKLGIVTGSQIATMDKCLAEIRKAGVKVYIHGHSRLTEGDKV